jgi:hypothetical protein
MGETEKPREEKKKEDDKFPAFDIQIGLTTHTTKIYMDGEQLKGVRAVKVEAHIDEVSVVTLEFVGTAEIHGITKKLALKKGYNNWTYANSRITSRS